MANDLTILYITACRTPPGWREYHLSVLREAARDIRVLTSAPQPVSLGDCSHQAGPHGYSTIYREMLRLSQIATTPYVAMAEDDVLYSREHFTEFRPPVDSVAYNRSRWSLYTWGAPLFHLKNRLSNAALIAPREYLIAALEERNRMHPDGIPDDRTGEVGRWRVDQRLGVSSRNCVEFWSTVPLIHLHHPAGCDPPRRGWKKPYGQLKANEIPHWGTAEEVVAKYR